MRKFIAICIVFATILWAFSDVTPNVKKQQNTTNFSIENALTHVKNISQKRHHVGTEGHKEVQNYLVKELEKLGLQTEIQTQTACNEKWTACTTVENIITKIEGISNGKSLLLLSHYDSNPHSSLGASDAGSGVVTILESVRAFLAKNKKPKNDIIIVFSDAEELGLLGAQAFVNHHPLAKNIGLVLNFEARGSGGSSFMLMETNGKNSKLITEFLKAKPNYPAANSLMYSIYKMLPNDTDLTTFREDGDINGFNFAFIDDHFDYHTAQDSFERMDVESLAHQADYLTTGLNYFSNADLSNLNSDEDYVYLNFPIVKMITYPFSYITPMLIVVAALFLLLIIFGLKNKKITIRGILKGFVPFLSALVICGAVSFGLWKLILIIHPQYQDILQGFTYNGHQYIFAFIFLNLWILFKIYNKFTNEKATDLLIAPITIWLIINVLIQQKLQGAGFFIIPVFIALFILAMFMFTNIKRQNKLVLTAIMSIPTVYIFTPLVELFPVGLGLKNLFISAIFIVLIVGLLLPIFHQYKQKNRWQTFFGFLAIIFFVITSFSSRFSVDKKRPNSLVYIQNEDDNNAYFATYNKTLDAYTKQIFSDDFAEGGIPSAETKSKYNSKFSYHKKTASRNIEAFKSAIVIDTVLDNDRIIEFSIQPQRSVSKYELLNNNAIHIKELCVNGVYVNKGKPFDVKQGTLLIYTMSNTDKEVKISLKVDKSDKPSITINEVSNDLLTHKSFTIQPRNDTMMPMPFITNDAIICTRTLKF